MRFFIVGTGRCGTTLLQKMMNCHPDLYVFNETHWIPKMYEYFGMAQGQTETLIDIVQRTNHVTGMPTTDLSAQQREALGNCGSVATVREFCDLIGETIAAERGKRFWADKTPDYGYFMGTLQAIWPQSRFVHLIRDGAAAAKSMARHIGYQVLAAKRQLFWCPLSLDFHSDRAGNTTQDPRNFVELWHRRMVRTRDEATRLRTGTYLELRFEDLIRSPQEHLTAVSSFLGLAADQSWLDEAAGLVRPDKLTAPQPKDMLAYFGESEKRLLTELGYST